MGNMDSVYTCADCRCVIGFADDIFCGPEDTPLCEGCWNNRRQAQNDALRAKLAEAERLLRACIEPIDSAIEDWALAGSAAAPEKWGALKAEIGAYLAGVRDG